MNKNKKIILGIIIAIIVLLAISLVVILNNKKSNNEKPTLSQEEIDNKNAIKAREIETPQEVIDNTKTNNNENILKKYCKNDHCYQIETISNYPLSDSTETSIKVNLENNSDKEWKAGFINLEFTTPTGIYTEFLHNIDIDPNQKSESVIQTKNNDIVDATNVEYKKLTTKELKEAMETLQ